MEVFDISFPLTVVQQFLQYYMRKNDWVIAQEYPSTKKLNNYTKQHKADQNPLVCLSKIAKRFPGIERFTVERFYAFYCKTSQSYTPKPAIFVRIKSLRVKHASVRVKIHLNILNKYCVI